MLFFIVNLTLATRRELFVPVVRHWIPFEVHSLLTDFFPHVAITTNHILGGLNSNTHHSQLWKLGNSRAGCHGDSATVGPLSLACHSSFLAAPSLVEGWFTLKGESLHHRVTTFMTTSKSNSARRPYLHVPSPCWNITDQLQSNTSMHPIILD